MVRQRCELARGLLEREETPPSLQALELAIIQLETAGNGTEKISSYGVLMMVNSLKLIGME